MNDELWSIVEIAKMHLILLCFFCFICGILIGILFWLKSILDDLKDGENRQC